MALMLLAEREHRKALRRERLFRDRTNPLDFLEDNEIIRRYRFTRDGIFRLQEELRPSLEARTRRSNPIPPCQQVLAALRFFATGSFYTVHADLHSISTPSVCRIVHRVSRALADRVDQKIKFPVDARDLAITKHDFYMKARFPGVVGVIDCTHVRLYGSPMGEDEYVFVNRKGYHSMNVQMICNANYVVTNVVARWPGSTHDSAILQASVIGEMFENGRLDGVLLGDTGYALRPWLMRPIDHPTTRGQRRFNSSLKRTRVIVEQMFGQLKRRFPCLVIGLRISPARASTVILACSVLHNLAKEYGEPEINDQVVEEEVEVPPYAGPLHDGQLHRAHLVQHHFNQAN